MQNTKHLKDESREQMNIVVIGHVDHGKSTVIGRLLADTDSLPEGKLEDVKAMCSYNARPFEYAFLLDALKDEQAQGITIDSARCFFKSAKREYIIIDAPGHIEFLKNMISGAARAEAGLLVIDAKEGVQENSRRHGYLLNMLGIKQVVVLVNKMDLVDYSEDAYRQVEQQYREFLNQIGTSPRAFIPVSARDGVNIAQNSSETPWFEGLSVLDALDSFEKEPLPVDLPLRLPVQDVYKFTEEGDDRRIVAGRIETGTLNIEDEVIFLPSGKRTKVKSIEGFNVKAQNTTKAGQSTGITLEKQIYVTSGELMCKVSQEQVSVGTHLKVNVFWMGRQPMVKGKRYKLKLGTARVPVWLRDIVTVLDASELTTDSNRQQIERHDVAECVLETLKPIAFDLNTNIAQTGRFVVIDNYEIAGGGVVLEGLQKQKDMTTERVEQREKNWERSRITPVNRANRYSQRSTLVLISGPAGVGKKQLAKALEEDLFNSGRLVYYLGLANRELSFESDIDVNNYRDEQIKRLGEVSHLFTDAGLILITTISGLDNYELDIIKQLNQPNDCRVINIGENIFTNSQIDLQLDEMTDTADALRQIRELLAEKKYIIEYYL